ncbi:MAG TPA: hypothetical protein VF148_09150 [Acidimicrobiia bacterium]
MSTERDTLRSDPTTDSSYEKPPSDRSETRSDHSLPHDLRYRPYDPPVTDSGIPTRLIHKLQVDCDKKSGRMLQVAIMHPTILPAGSRMRVVREIARGTW